MSLHEPMTATSTIVLAIDGQYDTAENELYVLGFWLPIVGPIPYTIRDLALSHGANWTLTIDDLARKLGMGPEGVPGMLWRARRHGFWGHHHDAEACVWTIPRLAPPIGPDELARRSEAFRDAHGAFLAGTANRARQG